jgi:hypothetical protein
VERRHVFQPAADLPPIEIDGTAPDGYHVKPGHGGISGKGSGSQSNDRP